MQMLMNCRKRNVLGNLQKETRARLLTCMKFDWTSSSLFTHFWRPSGVMCVVFVQCFHASGYWGDGQSIQWYVLTSRGPFLWPWPHYTRGVAVCSPWINNPHSRLSQKNGSHFHSDHTTKKISACKTFPFDVFILFPMALSTACNRCQHPASCTKKCVLVRPSCLGKTVENLVYRSCLTADLICTKFSLVAMQCFVYLVVVFH